LPLLRDFSCISPSASLSLHEFSHPLRHQ
jgi:hypothetical protein